MSDGCHEWANAYFTHVEKTSFFSAMPAFVYLIAGWQIIKNIPVLSTPCLSATKATPRSYIIIELLFHLENAAGA
jgi:hypothetical protein